jgi:PadR family transcriptional regulator, regulatory protein PadR
MPTKSAPKLSYQTLQVLRIFLDNPNGSYAGSDIAKTTGIMSGVLYPILLRLEGAKWLGSKWEAEAATELGRPRKRLYRLTPKGRREARDAFANLMPATSGREVPA